MIAFALALALQSDPPPFIQYLEEAEALGRATYLAGVCAGLDMLESDAEGVGGLVDDFQRRAMIAKTNGGLLDAALERGLATEKEALNVLFDVGPEAGPQYDRRVEQLVEYLSVGCADLTIDYPDTFKLPAEQ